MKRYKHLSQKEREKIMNMFYAGFSYRKIAREIKRSHTTVSREIFRNGYEEKKYWRLSYSSGDAEKLYKERRNRCNHRRTLLLYQYQYLINLYKQAIQELPGMRSPWAFSTRLKMERNISISHVTFYRYIRKYDRELEQSLRYKKDGYRVGEYKHKSIKYHDAPHISLRPIEAQNRSEIGHIESDTIVSKDHKGGVVVTADRCSRYYEVRKILTLTSQETLYKLIEMLSPHIVHTASFDRGSEFALYKVLEIKLLIVAYFARAYASREKGTVERQNREFRVYIPKGSDISLYSDQEIQFIQDRINSKPRKCLDGLCSSEVHFGKRLILLPN